MWKLAKPVGTSQQTFLTCISKVKNPDLKARLVAIEGDVVDASDAYEVAARTTTLHTLPSADNVAGQVTKDEMSAVYTERMARKGAPGRAIYDRLLSAPAHGRCPLCGHRTVSTLDHHLPKSLFPALAVTPANLVPACSDCNRAKLERAPQTSDEETLHPYYDDIEGDCWLYAEVIETVPAALRFLVEPPNHWDPILATRVRRHFRLLNLAQLYASQSAEELLNIRYYLVALFARAGASGVRNHLREIAVSCEQARINSWQTAAYKALAISNWYCEGGFG
jgi:hypothetical protein